MKKSNFDLTTANNGGTWVLKNLVHWCYETVSFRGPNEIQPNRPRIRTAPIPVRKICLNTLIVRFSSRSMSTMHLASNRWTRQLIIVIAARWNKQWLSGTSTLWWGYNIGRERCSCTVLRKLYQPCSMCPIYFFRSKHLVGPGDVSRALTRLKNPQVRVSQTIFVNRRK